MINKRSHASTLRVDDVSAWMCLDMAFRFLLQRVCVVMNRSIVQGEPLV